MPDLILTHYPHLAYPFPTIPGRHRRIVYPQPGARVCPICGRGLEDAEDSKGGRGGAVCGQSGYMCEGERQGIEHGITSET